MLTVQQVADRLRLTKHAVRYYCDQGLVPNIKRNNRNERLFDDEAILWLYNSKMLRNSGLSIKQIKRYVDLCLQNDDTVDERYNILINEKEHVIQKINDMQTNLKFLNKKISIYEQAKMRKNKDPLNPNIHNSKKRS